ncbi:hypothetical protein JAAARDRAFT_610237 [Jaapia argillacea MUCL 33604]|uniref:Uncharacterized protein n=1 Tax=Jaapia argillacea MUCL 33604 TaxID=933084 RepID=A0A067P5K3_9AGAM|nr:hypothetical protein JAAARDRAFT_610237 [Jaapia argillacea MUCL 33604]
MSRKRSCNSTSFKRRGLTSLTMFLPSLPISSSLVIYPPMTASPDQYVLSDIAFAAALRSGRRSCVGDNDLLYPDSISSSTISNQPGVGRTLGVLISALGKRVEAAFSRCSERLGHGPRAIVSRMFSLPHKYRCLVCPECHHRLSSYLPTNHSLFSLTPDGSSSIFLTLCQRCRDVVAKALRGDLWFRRGCLKLIWLLRDDSGTIPTRSLTASYISDIINLHHEFSTLFFEFDAGPAFYSYLHHMSYWPTHILQRFFAPEIFVSAHRALVCLSTSRLFACIQDLDSIECYLVSVASRGGMGVSVDCIRDRLSLLMELTV